jgi:hypothetical protein
MLADTLLLSNFHSTPIILAIWAESKCILLEKESILGKFCEKLIFLI